MKILKTFKVNEYYEDMKKPQYVKMPKRDTNNCI